MSTCLHCGDGLTGQKQFYCSNRCRRTAKRKRRYAKYRQTKPCRVCGNELPKWRSKYCSQHCRETAAVTQYRTNYVNKYVKKARLLRDCINCGQQFETLNSRFCSSKCRYQHRDRNRPRAKKTDRQRNREYYFRADLLTKRRERRALMLAARAVYQELVGAVVKQKLLVTLAAAAPLVEIGNWSSYIVLPSVGAAPCPLEAGRVRLHPRGPPHAAHRRGPDAARPGMCAGFKAGRQRALPDQRNRRGRRLPGSRRPHAGRRGQLSR